MLIDCLTHITESGEWFFKKYNAKIERLLEEMSYANVQKAVLVANSPLNDNEYVLSISKEYKGKFLPVAAINPSGMSEETIDKKILTFKINGFIGIKIHPRFCGLALDSSDIKNVLKVAGKHNMICFICTLHRPPSRPLNRPLYDVIHEICNENQQTKLVLVHGGYYELLQTSEIIRSYENVLLDLSITLPRFAKSSIGRDIAYLFSTFEKRIILGSDFPEYTYTDVLNSLKEIDVNINDFIGKGPFGENLLRLIQL